MTARGSSDGRYLPIGDYAFIGDGRTGALISREGSIDWLCMPEFFTDSVFAAVLDADRGGRFAIRPAGPYRSHRRYLPDTAVLETTFEAADGVLRLTDCLAIVCDDGRLGLQPERELLRRVEAVSGQPALEVIFEPRPDYGRHRPRLLERGRNGWHLECRNRLYVLRSELPLTADPDDSRLVGHVRLEPGRHYDLSISSTDNDIAVLPALGAQADARLSMTVDWWRQWSGRCRYRGPYRDLVIRSAITLKLLNFPLSGAMIAAPTTSLPEAIGGARNWDYRFCWLRDAAFTLRSFMDLGYRDEAEAFLGWLLHSTRLSWPELDVLYTAYGRPPPPERTLAHLEGYRGSGPVRTGNGADRQLQLDVYGELILAVYDYAQRGGHLDAFERRLAVGFGRTVCRRWREPDSSIWEVRGERRHYTYSKLMCWAALDGLLKLHEAGTLRVPEAQFRAERDAIRAAIEAHARGPDGAYRGIFDTDDVDAAMLQLSRVGYRAPADPVLTRTYELIQSRLGHGPLLKRYGSGFDEEVGEEGAFGVCSFWAVGFLVNQGRLDEARGMFEQIAGYANDVGLFAEEIDPASGAALGNFPQAFTHIGLVDAALALQAAQEAPP